MKPFHQSDTKFCRGWGTMNRPETVITVMLCHCCNRCHGCSTEKIVVPKPLNQFKYCFSSAGNWRSFAQVLLSVQLGGEHKNIVFQIEIVLLQCGVTSGLWVTIFSLQCYVVVCTRYLKLLHTACCRDMGFLCQSYNDHATSDWYPPSGMWSQSRKWL